MNIRLMDLPGLVLNLTVGDCCLGLVVCVVVVLVARELWW